MAVEYREEPCRSALNRVERMPFRWSLNPYMGCAHRCTFCYVRSFERRAGRPSDDRYGRSIRVKINIADVLRRELTRKSWRHELVAIGAATDPYQPAEGRYRLTRSCIEVLAETRTPLSIITRGPMIVRDIDVLTEAARQADASVTFSIPTLDPRVWRLTEPGTAPPVQRLRAVKRLVDAGIRAGVALAPLLPGISDQRENLDAVIRAAREAGATHVWAKMLYLQPGTREYFLEHVARDWPEEMDRYERLYAHGGYLRHADADPPVREARELIRIHDIGDRRSHPIAPAEEPGQLGLPL